MWLTLTVFVTAALELWGGSYLAPKGSDVLAWASWLKALFLLGSGIAYVGSLSPSALFIGAIVFVVGVVGLTNHQDRIRATRNGSRNSLR